MAKNVGIPAIIVTFLGVLLFIVPFVGTFVTLFGIILSKSALSRIKAQPKKHSGTVFAVFSLIVSIIFFILSLLSLGLVVFLFGSGYLVGKFF